MGMRFLLTLLLVLVASPAAVRAGVAGEVPNFLVILADDCTYNDLPLYGGQNARTPNLDALAARGLTFDKAYLCSAMCQPCRSELYSGLYPMSNGSAWNHSASRPGTKSLPHFLEPAGYRVGLAGKIHVKPAASFPFEGIEGFDANCVRDPTQPHDLTPLGDFMSRDAGPFCAVVALVEPHVPWTMGDASAYQPYKEIKLPPNLADTPSTREHFAHYLAEITYMDAQVGEILATLEATGKGNNTLVLFSSEQGSQFPGCKWTNWDTGVHTALIAAWPGKVAEGERTDALVQYADLVPTLLELAGAEVEPEWKLDGHSFATVLDGTGESTRRFVYHLHNNLPEGPAYPIRAVGNGEYRYLRNLSPDELYLEKHLMGGGRLNNPYWATWMGAGPGHPNAYPLIKRYMRRPAEQLYRTHGGDPYEMINLVEDPKHKAALTELAAALDAWLAEENDPGAPVDTPEALEAARTGNHLY